MLIYPGASPRAVGLLSITLLMKMPIYAIGLYLSTLISSTAPIAAFVGCTLVPCILTLEALGRMAKHTLDDYAQRHKQHETKWMNPEVRDLSARVAEMKLEAQETLQELSRVHTARTGVS